MGVNFDDVSGPMVSPTKFAHIVLRTNNKKRLADFYLEFLGATMRHENEKIAFLTYDSEHHRMAIIQIPELKDKDTNTCGLEHFAYTFDTLDDLFLAYRQRKAKGMMPYRVINHGFTISMYYKDPDGNAIETQWDSMDTDAATKFMESQQFERNPIGIEFDPEEFLKRIQSGESLDSLIKRGDEEPELVSSGH